MQENMIGKGFMANKLDKANSSDDKKTQFYNSVINKYQFYAGSKNTIYYLMIVLLNICIIGVLSVVFNSINKVEGFNHVIQGVNWMYLYLMISIFGVILLLKCFPDYVALYSKTKKSKFIRLIGANIKYDFYNMVTINASGKIPMFAKTMVDGGVDNNISVDIAYSKKITNKISFCVYSILALLIGSIFVFNKEYIVMFVASLCVLFISCIILIIVIAFGNNKERTVKLVGGFSKWLYKLHLIKDYEAFYKNIMDKIIICRASLKFHKGVIITQLLCAFLVNFLRHFLIYCLLNMFSIGRVVDFISIIYNVTIIDLIVSVLPLRGGSYIYSLMFLWLLQPVFGIDVIVWVVIINRVFDYLLYVVLFLIVELIDNMLVKNNKNNSREAKIS